MTKALPRGRRDREEEIRAMIFKMPITRESVRILEFISWVNAHYAWKLKKLAARDKRRVERINFLLQALAEKVLTNKMMRKAFVESAGKVFMVELRRIRWLYSVGKIDFPASYDTDTAARLAMFVVFDRVRAASGINIERAFEKLKGVPKP